MTARPILIEACVESLDEALAAEAGGADRLELCSDLSAGGTTPARALVETVKRGVRLPVAMMVRPRGGAFVFSHSELDATRRDLDLVRSLGADAVVIGLLDDAGRVDQRRTRELVERAAPTPVTFHRAFDEAADRAAALDALIGAGVARVLTGGGRGAAVDGVRELQALVEQAGERITIMAGGHVRGANAARIVAASGVREVHARCERDPQRIRAIRMAVNTRSDPPLVTTVQDRTLIR